MMYALLFVLGVLVGWICKGFFGPWFSKVTKKL